MSNQSVTRAFGHDGARMFQLAPATAFLLQASIIVSFLAGSSAPTPLYAYYQAAWGFTPITVTVVFGSYAIAVLSALLVAGSLSDYIGRRPVLFAALGAQMIAMWLFATAGGVSALIAARVVQGLATGAASAALGAGMLDIDKARGTFANAIAPVSGTATGALVASLLVNFLPAPTQLIYGVMLAIFAVQLVGVALMPESVTPKPGALASLRPHVAVPPQARRALYAAIPALVAIWSLFGFYGSLGPALGRAVTHSRSPMLGGIEIFAMAGMAAVAIVALRAQPAARVIAIGALALIAGVGLSLVGVAAGAPALFFAGLALAGFGFGGGFQGALRMVLPLAQPHERAGLLAILYVVSYLSMGAPAVLGGVAVVASGSLVGVAYVYGAVVMALALLALVLARLTGPRVN